MREVSPEDSWFQTLEFPKKTALLVMAEKGKKYSVMLKETRKGTYIVMYRGYTNHEKEEKKKAAKEERAAAKKAI